MGSWPAEDALSKLFGRSQTLKCLWVRIADDVKDPRSEARHLVLCRDSEEGRECGEIWNLIPFRESGDRGQQNSTLMQGG